MHLILHKVRGEAAFDVADQMEVDGETWWIIPTSGHRAYPYMYWNLVDIGYPFNGNTPTIPDDWPDHYQVKKEPKFELNIGQLVSGLVKFKRRF